MWKYIWGITFKEFLSTVRWADIFFFIFFLTMGYSLGSWFGLFIAWVFCYLMGRAEDGAVGDVWNEFPDEEYPPNTCSAGIEDCKICQRTYIHDHEFNLKYYQSLKWWNKII